MSLLSEARHVWALLLSALAIAGSVIFGLIVLVAMLSPTPENVGRVVTYAVEDALSGVLMIAKLAAIPVIGGFLAVAYIFWKRGRF